GYLMAVLRAMAADDRQEAMRIELLSAEERELLLTTWNRTEVSYPRRCVQQLFEEQVRRDAEAVALVYEDERVSYGELNARANRLARHLVSLGVRPDTRVGLCVERSPEMVVGLLAVLKAGGAYVPLDPGYPSERLAFMLEDCGPRVVLTHAAARAALNAALPAAADRTSSESSELDSDPVAIDVPVVLDLVADAGRWAEGLATDLDPGSLGLTPDHLAYVIYTSGSTGKPKGVMVEHAQVDRLFETTRARFDFNERDVWCLFHSFAFDFSVWELWGALRYGGRLVVVPRDVARSS